jgi:hypothetical protein
MEAKQGILDFVFLQHGDEVLVGHVIDVREDCAEGVGCNQLKK